jgi:hypothetical protein
VDFDAWAGIIGAIQPFAYFLTDALHECVNLPDSSTIVLAPNPEWVKTLPNGKLPDRTDFMTYDRDLAGRVKVWHAAARASQQMADEFSRWLQNPVSSTVQPL